MKNKLRFLVPFIPVIGIIIIFKSNMNSWVNVDERGNYESPLDNTYIFLTSAFFQAISIVSIILLLANLK